MRKHGKSLLFAALAFILIIFLNFFLPRLLPGDPVHYLTGMDADIISPDLYARYRAGLGLDLPLHEQFFRYLGTLFGGSLGYSYHYNSNVSALISSRLGNTLQLAVPAVILSTLIALFAGLQAAYRRGSAGEHVASGAVVFLDAFPSFLVAMVLLILFSFTLKWFPHRGLNSIGVRAGWDLFLDRVWHLTLPVLTMILLSFPSKYILIRNHAASLMTEKFLLYARARGLSAGQIKRRYLLRGSFQPILTAIGLNVASALSGSIVIEKIFSVNGVGSLINEAIARLDFPTLQGALFVIAGISIAAITITDLLCILLDPRQRRAAAHDA